MNELRLQTPEGVSFSFILASPASRMLACLVDVAVTGACSKILTMALALLAVISKDLANGLMIVAYFAVTIFYGILCESAWRGQTLGKRLLRLRVIDQTGLRLTLTQVVVRNLLRFVDMLPLFYLLGGVTCLFSSRHQRLGDIAADTVVIYQPKLTEPDLSGVALPKFNSLRAHPHLVARLRQRITPREAGVLLEALLRREEFDPAARLDLFAELAAHCRGLVEFPPEAMEMITDEQIVRNIVDVVFEKAR
jgi:uncharacterized RDD family membrane protein YckC